MVTGLIEAHSWIKRLWQGDSAALSMARKYAQWNMSKWINKISVVEWWEGIQDPALAGRWEEDGHSSEAKAETETRNRDNDWVIYAVSSSLVSLHYGKKRTKAKNEPTRLVSKHNDLSETERGSHKVELIELGCDYPSVRVTWSWNIQYARYGHLWLRKHNLIAWITTQTFDIGLNQLRSCIGPKLLHKSSGPGCWRSPCSIFRSSSQVSR